MKIKFSVFFVWVLIIGVIQAHAEEQSRSWEFDVQWPGMYQLFVEHNIGKDVPMGTKVSYLITISGKTSQRTLPLLVNRSFIPLQANIKTPQNIVISVKGIPQSILQHTHVYFLQKDSYPPNKHRETAQNRSYQELKQLKAILEQSEEQIDLTYANLMINKMIDPTIDMHATLKKINAMVADVRAMVRPKASSNEKVAALKAYLYQKGPWNSGRTFQYDFDDPLGTKVNNKLIPNYLESRKGNCVSMPLLFIMMGERLGLDITATVMPRHVSMKYRDDATGNVYNLEATSGGGITRDIWYRQQFPGITDLALKNGIYLRKMSKKETVATMAMVLVQHYREQKQFEKIIALCDLVLKYFPNEIRAITYKSLIYYELSEKHFIRHYPDPNDIPVNMQGYFFYLQYQNHWWHKKAKWLGWVEPDKDYEAKYLQRVKEAAKNSH